VNNTNDVPVISTQDVLKAVEDQFYIVDYEADDDDQDTLTWSLTTSATWLSIELITGVISGTPSNLDVGSWDVTVSCNDGNGGIASHAFSIDVDNVNDAPQITYYLPDEIFPTVEEGMELAFNISYSDEDSSTFTITWTLDGEMVRQNVPFWNYQPAYGSAGDHEIIVNVTDSAGAGIEKSWIVIVTPANRAPVIDSYEPMNLKPVMDPDEFDLVFNVSASDPDSDTLTYQWFVNGNDTGVRSSTFTMDRGHYDDGNFRSRGSGGGRERNHNFAKLGHYRPASEKGRARIKFLTPDFGNCDCYYCCIVIGLSMEEETIRNRGCFYYFQ
jgi:hypothetical protein